MKQAKRIGGNLEQALESKQGFNPMQVLKEGFQLTKVSIPSLLGAAFLALVIFSVILLLALQFFNEGTFDVENPRTVMIMLMIQIIVMPPLFAAIHVMGMRHAIGQKTQVSDLFAFIKQPLPFILIALLTQVATQLSAGLLPGITSLVVIVFISVALSMAIPLAAEYRLPALQAIRCSFIAVLKRSGAFFSVYIIFFVLFLLSLLTFGLGLILVVPFFYNVKGVMYREVFGIGVERSVSYPDQGQPDQQTAEKVDNDTWGA